MAAAAFGDPPCALGAWWRSVDIGNLSAIHKTWQAAGASGGAPGGEASGVSREQAVAMVRSLHNGVLMTERVLQQVSRAMGRKRVTEVMCVWGGERSTGTTALILFPPPLPPSSSAVNRALARC